jgi:hypothetical protein
MRTRLHLLDESYSRLVCLNKVDGMKEVWKAIFTNN